MKSKFVLFTLLLSMCAAANAEWFLRGSHNSWQATPLESAGAGTNTVQVNGVVFAAAGNVKFDRFGDWSENYGVGGRSGTNVPVAAGTWNIKFFTDSKNWQITAATNVPANPGVYHLRGTFNEWQEGTLLTQVGATNVYERCVNFSTGNTAGGPRFKIDPNGAWGDAVPTGDYMVSASWVKVSFNATTKVISAQQNLNADCATASSSMSTSSTSSAMSSSSSQEEAVYHIRGTHNAWAEGMLMSFSVFTGNYTACINMLNGDDNGGPRFLIDKNGGWGEGTLPASGDFKLITPSWAHVTFNPVTSVISVQQNMPSGDCGMAPTSSSSVNSSSTASSVVVSSSVVSSSDASSSVATSSSVTTSSSIATSSSVSTSSAISSTVSSSSVSSTAYHLRGSFNEWAEDTLMNKIGNTGNYEQCVNFATGDTNGGARFKIDPNGAWGDAIPANDYTVATGWVKISFNSSTKVITTQQNLPANCGANTYHLRGTHNAWAEGDLFESVDGIQPVWKICRDFGPASTVINPRFKVDLNGAWGSDAFPASDVATTGWTSIVIEPNNLVSVTKDMAPNCAAAQ